jgi:YebC/PmpR family DNA-binding regulatory protein
LSTSLHTLLLGFRSWWNTLVRYVNLQLTLSSYSSTQTDSVPVENISRAIKKASEGNTEDYKEYIYEAYGHGGASIVVNVLTDNTNRAAAEVRLTVNKRQGKMAESGSVLFMYDKRGMITVPSVLDEEALLEAAIEAGCDDYEMTVEDDTTILLTDPKEASMMLDAIKGLGYEDGLSMKLGHVSKAPVEVSEEEFDKNMDIIDALEDLDDVDSVEHNMSN